MNCIGITYRQAPLSVRSSLAVSPEERSALFRQFRMRFPAAECVALSTCNRFELYYEADRSLHDMEQFLCKARGLNYEEVIPYISVYEGDSAVRHLCRVACGIDSMVLGEDEILHQLKEAYAVAHDDGMTGFALNTIFQMAVNAAKEIKSETGLSETPVSIGTLAANEASHFLDGPVNVLVIGLSGKMGGIVARNLAAKSHVHLMGTVREHRPRSALPDVPGMELVPYPDRYQVVDRADVIISATTSPHYTLTRRRFEEAIRTEKPRLLIDLAVPEDLDREFAGLSSVRLMNLDEFRELARTNNVKKKELAEQAATAADAYAEDILKELRLHELIGYLPELNAAVEADGVDRLIYSLRKLADRRQVDAVTDWLEDYLNGGGDA